MEKKEEEIDYELADYHELEKDYILKEDVPKKDELKEDYKLKEIKIRTAYEAKIKLKKMFPECYEKGSLTEILIDIFSDPINIIVITGGAPKTEFKIGEIDLKLGTVEEEYYTTPIMTIRAIPLKKPIELLLMK